MKRLGSIGKLAAGAGAVVAHEYKTAKNRPPAEPLKISPLGYIILVAGGILSAIIAFSYAKGILGLLLFFVLFFVVMIVGAFVGMLTYKDDDALIEEALSESSGINEETYDEETKDTITAIQDLLVAMAPYEEYEKEVAGLSKKEKVEVLTDALNKYYYQVSTNLEIPDGSEDYTEGFISHFSLPSDEIMAYDNSFYVEYEKALNLRDILNGVTPTRVTIGHPINMTKGEQPLWAFSSVDYLEEVVQRSNVGATSALSVKIAKGIYYHVGAFKGKRLITSSLKLLAKGDLIVTNKNIYLYTPERTVKYPVKKIIAYVPFEDGLGVQPEKTNGKTVYFKGLDGRYAFNLVTNIKNLC